MLVFLVQIFIILPIASVAYVRQYIDLVVDYGISIVFILKFILLLMPTLLLTGLPALLAISIVFIYWRLESDAETRVLRAAGVSYGRLARPSLALAMAVVGVAYILSLHVAPSGVRHFRVLEGEITMGLHGLPLREYVPQRIEAGLTVYVGRRTGGDWYAPVLIHDVRDPADPVTLIGARGTVVRTTDQLVALVEEGVIAGRPESQPTNSVAFGDYAFALQSIGPRTTGLRSPSAVAWLDLFDPAVTDREGVTPDEAVAEVHHRLAGPLLNLTLALIALAGLFSSAGVSRHRGLLLCGLALSMIGVLLTHHWLAKVAATGALDWWWVYVNATVPALLAAGLLWELDRKPVWRALRLRLKAR